MDETTQEIYSEVYSVLNLLGKSFINKLPSSLYEMIKKEKSSSYNPQYSTNFKLEEQDIKKESLSMIALFHLNYWCETEKEKNELKNIFLENEERYQAEIREKYNPDNLFKKKKIELIQKEELNKYQESVRIPANNYSKSSILENNNGTKEINENLPIIIKKETIFTKIFNFVKSIFNILKK